jgi:hypothetical protein
MNECLSSGENFGLKLHSSTQKGTFGRKKGTFGRKGCVHPLDIKKSAQKIGIPRDKNRNCLTNEKLEIASLLLS